MAAEADQWMMDRDEFQVAEVVSHIVHTFVHFVLVRAVTRKGGKSDKVCKELRMRH